LVFLICNSIINVKLIVFLIFYHIFVNIIYYFQIPLRKCISKNIFCIDQFVLIFQKVVEDYYTANKDAIKVIEFLRVSKQLLKISIALFEYIESSNEYNIMIEINKIEEIKRYIFNKYYTCVDLLTNHH